MGQDYWNVNVDELFNEAKQEKPKKTFGMWLKKNLGAVGMAILLVCFTIVVVLVGKNEEQLNIKSVHPTYYIDVYVNGTHYLYFKNGKIVNYTLDSTLQAKNQSN